jgi:serine protease Do
MRIKTWMALTGVSALALMLFAFPGTSFGQSGAPAPKAPQAPTAPSAPSAPQACELDNAVAEAADLAVADELAAATDQLAAEGAQLAVEEDLMESQEIGNLDALTANLASLQSEELAKEAASLTQEKKHVIEISPDSQELWTSDDNSGWLGIEISEVNADKAKELKLSETRGVVVGSVDPDSPAAKAGLKENDVILSYEGQNVEGTIQFRRLVRETPPGRSVPLSISRDGSVQTITIEVGERSSVFGPGDKDSAPRVYKFKVPNVQEFKMPDFDFNPMVTPEAMDFHTPLLGIGAEDLSGQLGDYFGVPSGEGILVREVRSGTPAEKAGLKAGDVITKVDGQTVKSTRDLRSQLRQKIDQKTVTLSVLRKGSEISVPVAIEKPRRIDAPQIVNRAQL